MSRRALTAIELPAVGVALAVCTWTLSAEAHVPGHAPWTPFAAIVAVTLLAIAAPAAGLLLWLEARHVAQRRRLRKSLHVLHRHGSARHRGRVGGVR